MQKMIYIPMDTTIQNTIECDKLIKRGDTLTLQIKVFVNAVLADLTGQTIDLILRKSDNTLIEKTITSVANGIITCTLTEQATLVQGIVNGEVQIYDTTTQLATNTFTFVVDESIADDVLAASQNEIQTLIDLKNVIDINNLIISQYVTNITAIAGTASSVEALANIKAYIDNNLIALQQANANATANISNLKVQNDKTPTLTTNLKAQNDVATSNISTLTTKNSEAVTNKSNIDSSITNANTSKVALDTSKTNADTSKTALNASITNANTSKSALDISKTNADASKVALDASITKANQFVQDNTDIEDLVLQVNANTTQLAELADKIGIIPVDGGTFFDTNVDWTVTGGTF